MMDNSLNSVPSTFAKMCTRSSPSTTRTISCTPFLAKNGVHEIVRVVEGDERVHILAKVDGTLLSELSIMVFEAGDEFVYIKMDGDIDVAKIREVTGSFDVNINGLDALSMNL